MTTWDHETVKISRLLSGDLDPDTIELWPEGARRHLEQCEDCQSWVRADALLRAAGQLIQPRSASTSRAVPNPTHLRKQLGGQRPAPVGLMVRHYPVFGSRDFRSVGELEVSAAALEVVRTPEGVRAWDPDARYIALFAAQRRSPVRLLSESTVQSSGVGVDLQYQVDGDAQVIAISALEPLDPDEWGLWLADVFRAGDLADTDIHEFSDRIHIKRLTFTGGIQPARIQYRSESFPPVTPPVESLLDQARAAGGEYKLAQAGAHYHQAMMLAEQTEDVHGRLLATLGIANVLQGFGYTADAERLIEQMVASEALTPWFAHWICTNMVSMTECRGDHAEARSWLEELRRIPNPDGERRRWGLMSTLLVAEGEGNWPEVVDIGAAIGASDLPGPVVAYGRAARVLGLVRLARDDEASQEFQHLDRPEPAQVEALCRYEQARVSLDQVRQGHSDWASVFSAMDASFRVLDDEGLDVWRQASLISLVEGALDDGDEVTAWSMLRRIFLDARQAADHRVRLLAVVVGRDGLLAIDPQRAHSVRRLPFTEIQMSKIIANARQQLQSGRTDDSVRVLAALLFPSGCSVSDTVLVASDGVLAGIPMLAIAAAAAGPRRPIPAIRVVLGHRHAPPASGAVTAIATLADARGDLPHADREVREDEAVTYVRGHQVTRRALASLAPVGLLHIGVHARRESGLPALMFADGPVTAIEISQMQFEGNPVVLLAGCSTGISVVHRGVERSLANAFLGSGASAVIAHLWPVSDSLAHRFVRHVVDVWPFHDPAMVVARVATQMRAQGLPARIWAAPEVY